MKKRSVFISIIQILIVLVGLAALSYVSYFFIFNMNLLGSNEADLGEIIVAFILSLPFQLIISVVSAFAGTLTVIIASAQRHNEETKDKFSLVMVIIGIVLIALPIIMDALLFIACHSNN